MHLIKENGILALTTEAYTVTFPGDRPYVYLDGGEGSRLAELFIPSSVHPLHDRDDTVRIGCWKATESPGWITFSLTADSSVWKSKTYHIRCYPDRLSYSVDVEGTGQLAEADYFGGYFSGQRRWGSGFFWSGHHFRQGWNPEPNSEELYYFKPASGSSINLTGVPLPAKSDWFFTPPPFCFAFEGGTGWLGMGVHAGPGENRFTEFAYHGQLTGYYLSLAYEGHTRVDGLYRLPSIDLIFASSPESTLAAHVRALSDDGAVQLSRREPTADWWREPIFCGWGAQSYLAALQGCSAPDLATQANYEQFIGTLTENGIFPGIVVLDDKWQASYGENCVDERKWPALTGFVREQHSAGRKVLLWLQAWNPEGLPADECITNAAGMPLACDPSNPAYESRLRRIVRSLLSPYGYDADGFKIDFTARIPSGPGSRTFGDVWGLELLRRYLAIIYDESKRTKADALVMTHTPHPYLSDVVDMIRLNDINKDKDVRRTMTQRARIAAIACPAAIIDTDNWPIPDRVAWRDYVRLQPELGVPSLYYATHIDSTQEPLEPDDYRLVRETWEQYRANLLGRPFAERLLVRKKQLQ